MYIYICVCVCMYVYVYSIYMYSSYYYLFHTLTAIFSQVAIQNQLTVTVNLQYNRMTLF